jgi:hypothetical protein
MEPFAGKGSILARENLDVQRAAPSPPTPPKV